MGGSSLVFIDIAVVIDALGFGVGHKLIGTYLYS